MRPFRTLNTLLVASKRVHNSNTTQMSVGVSYRGYNVRWRTIRKQEQNKIRQQQITNNNALEEHKNAEPEIWSINELKLRMKTLEMANDALKKENRLLRQEYRKMREFIKSPLINYYTELYRNNHN